MARWFRTPDWVLRDIQSILHLPLWRRLIHEKARRTVIAMAIGLLLILIGSVLTINRIAVAEFLRTHDLVIDCSSGLMHDIGAVPIIRYFEPFWTLVAGGEE